jgi:predicted acylesterase/phospholipase RssA
MSVSIPLLWQEVEWQAEWGTYRGEEIAGHVVVDGGLLSNFPIELLISDMPHVIDVMGPKGSAVALGFLIDESLPVAGAPPAATWPAGILAMEALRDFQFGGLRTVQRINRLINTATAAHDKMVTEALEELVVRLPAKGYNTTEFDMSDARRNALIQAARQATAAYFDCQAGVTAPVDGVGAEREVARRSADHVATHMLEP